jgi:outer membrane protein assembly factor BamB
MRHSMRLSALPATRSSRRTFLKWSVVIGATILVIGSVLAWWNGDDAEYPAVGALRLTDGAVAWSVRSPDEAYRTVVGANDAVVLVEVNESTPSVLQRIIRIIASGAGSRQTIAFDAADGSERWRRSTGDTPTPPGPFDGQGIVVLADPDADALAGIDVSTGEERWRVESGEVPLAHSPTVVVVWDAASQASPARFRGIDRLTGDELWVSDILVPEQHADFAGRSPAAALDEVIVVPTGATITAIDMRSGAILWEAPHLGHLDAADGTIVGKRGTNEPGNWITLTALDAASGQERWTAPQQLFSYGDYTVGDGVIVIMDQAAFPVLIAYELSSGSQRWRVPLLRSLWPQRISGTSLVMRGEREVAVLSTSDGAMIWSAMEPLGSSDQIVAQSISVGSNDAAVFVASNSVPAACAPRCD